MPRQLTRPIIIRGLRSEAPDTKGEVTELERIPVDDPIFSEGTLQKLLLNHPSLLPISEIEPVFDGAKPICRELPVNGGAADLLLINPAGFITVVETKLWRNPESRYDVVAQVVRYASDMARWSYSTLRDQVRKVPKNLMAADYADDPILELVKVGEGDAFDKNAFRDSVSQNLSRGRLLLLIVGDAIREQLERITEHLQHFPTLDFALGLVEIALFRERSDSTDPIVVQPKVLAKTRIIERTVVQLKAPLKPSDIVVTVEKGTQPPHTITEEEYYEELNRKVGPKVVQFVREVLAEAKNHQLRVDWMRSGPVLKYDEKMRETFFNFGGLHKSGVLYDRGDLFWRFRELGLPSEIYLEYLDEIAGLVPGVSRQVVYKGTSWECEILQYGGRQRAEDFVPLEKLIPIKQEWLGAMDKAIRSIHEALST